MGDVGKQLFLLLDHALEGIHHVAHVVGQLADLVTPAEVGDLGLQAAGSQQRDRFLQLQYGAGQAPGEQQAERGADQHGDPEDADRVIQDLDEQEQIGGIDVEPEIDVVLLAAMLHQKGACDGLAILVTQHGVVGIVGIHHEANHELAGMDGGLDLAVGTAYIDVVHRQHGDFLHRLCQLEIPRRVCGILEDLHVVLHPHHLVGWQRELVARIQVGQADDGGHHHQQDQPEPDEDLGGEAADRGRLDYSCSSHR